MMRENNVFDQLMREAMDENNEGYKLLATAIIEQAVKDLQDPDYKEDAEEFLHSNWCNNILECMGVDFTGETILKKAATLK